MANSRVLVLGSGLVARPCVEYILRNKKNIVTIGMWSLFFSVKPLLLNITMLLFLFLASLGKCAVSAICENICTSRVNRKISKRFIQLSYSLQDYETMVPYYYKPNELS